MAENHQRPREMRHVPSGTLHFSVLRHALRFAVSACLAMLPASLAAQTSNGASPQRWDVEVHGSATSIVRAGGTPRLPDPGPGLTTSSPVFPTRATSSWFFGDGAQLLNDAAAEFGLAPRIAPLDDAIARLGRRQTTGAFGVRVARTLTPRWSVAVTVDALTPSGTLSGDESALIEQTRAGFVSTFTSLLATGPFPSARVDATQTTAPGSRKAVVIGGEFERHLPRIAGLSPSATVGAGMALGSEGTAVSLEGRYRFQIAGGAPIDETDRVTLRMTHRTRPALFVGGGIARGVSARLGIRASVRLMLSRPLMAPLIDASPVLVTGTPAGVIESFTYPAIQFSNNASTGRRSSLSGGAIQDFPAWTSGIQMRVLSSVGMFVRF